MFSVFAQYLTVNSSSLVTNGPYILRSKNLKLGFMAFSMTSLTYIGSGALEQCMENQVSAILSLATSSNFVCRTLGGALVQLSVLLRLSLLADGLLLTGTSLFECSV